MGRAYVGHGESSFVQSESLMLDGGGEVSDQEREPGGALARVMVIMLAPQALRKIRHFAVALLLLLLLILILLCNQTH